MSIGTVMAHAIIVLYLFLIELQSELFLRSPETTSAL